MILNHYCIVDAPFIAEALLWFTGSPFYLLLSGSSKQSNDPHFRIRSSAESNPTHKNHESILCGFFGQGIAK